MKKRQTNFVLAEIGGMPVVLTEYYRDRDYLPNEKTNTEEHAFIRFANAKNLPELLLALEEIYDEFDMLDFLDDLIAIGEKPAVLNAERAAEICGYFSEEKPTKTTLDHTKEAIEAWSFKDVKMKYEAFTIIPLPDGTEKKITNNQSPLNLFTPLEDIVKAAEDLRRTSLMFAWLIGKCDFHTVHGLTYEDRKIKHRTLSAEQPQYLHKYYEALASNTGNEWVQYSMNNAVSQIHLYEEGAIESTISDYVRGCFNILMSDTRVTLNSSDLSVENECTSILSSAWTYFARGLNKDFGPGAIGVCRHCGRFYEQKRKTRQYCSDSCRVMALRKGEEKTEYYVSRISKTRALRKEAEEKAKMNLP